MITLLLAAFLQSISPPAESPDPAAEAELAAQMEALQAQLIELTGTLEDVAAGFEAVEDDDPAQLGAAWSRALTVNARELSWYQVEDPILLAAQLALELDALGTIIATATDEIGAAYSIGYDFNTTGETTTGPDGEPIDAPVEDIPDDNTPASEFCADGDLETGTRETPGGILTWRDCVVQSNTDGFDYLRAIQLRAGDEENGSRAMVAISVASDDEATRDAMAEPASRVVEIMGRALTLPVAAD